MPFHQGRASVKRPVFMVFDAIPSGKSICEKTGVNGLRLSGAFPVSIRE
jgi:hypothetical protein